MQLSSVVKQAHSLTFFPAILFLCRAANVFSCAYLVNISRPEHRRIPLNHQKALCFSGEFHYTVVGNFRHIYDKGFYKANFHYLDFIFVANSFLLRKIIFLFLFLSAFWERGSPDLPAWGLRRGSKEAQHGPSSSTQDSRPSRGAKPRGADDTRLPQDRRR